MRVGRGPGIALAFFPRTGRVDWLRGALLEEGRRGDGGGCGRSCGDWSKGRGSGRGSRAIGLRLGGGRVIVALRLGRVMGRSGRLGGKRWRLLPDALLGDLLGRGFDRMLGGDAGGLLGGNQGGLGSCLLGGPICGEFLSLPRCLLGGGLSGLVCGLFGFHARCLLRSLTGCLFGGLLGRQLLLMGGLSRGGQLSLVCFGPGLCFGLGLSLDLGFGICLGLDFFGGVTGFGSLRGFQFGVGFLCLAQVFFHGLLGTQTSFSRVWARAAEKSLYFAPCKLAQE